MLRRDNCILDLLTPTQGPLRMQSNKLARVGAVVVFCAVTALSNHALAGPITAEFSGSFTGIFPPTTEFAVGDAVTVVVGYDSDATPTGSNCSATPAPTGCAAADYSPGNLYSFDPSSAFLEFTIGGATRRFGGESNIAEPFIPELLWYRDNSGDRAADDGFGPADGLSILKSALLDDGSGYIAAITLRSSDTSIFTGPALPGNPLALAGAELASFSIEYVENADTFEGFQGGFGVFSVPAPATIPLLVIGLGLLGPKLRRKA